MSSPLCFKVLQQTGDSHLDNLPVVPLSKVLFQRHGASSPCTKPVTDCLDEILPLRQIQLNRPIAWSLHSPDLTPPNYWFWTMWSKVYYPKPETKFNEAKACCGASGNFSVHFEDHTSASESHDMNLYGTRWWYSRSPHLIQYGGESERMTI